MFACSDQMLALALVIVRMDVAALWALPWALAAEVCYFGHLVCLSRGVGLTSTARSRAVALLTGNINLIR